MGHEPVTFCGKPELLAVKAALDRWQIADPSTCLFVGDNLHTDIAAAHTVGADSVIVLTGVCRPGDVAACDKCPTYVLDSICELPDLLIRIESAPRDRNVEICHSNGQLEA